MKIMGLSGQRCVLMPRFDKQEKRRRKKNEKVMKYEINENNKAQWPMMRPHALKVNYGNTSTKSGVYNVPVHGRSLLQSFDASATKRKTDG